MKFYATLLKCLRDCYENFGERLTINMNLLLILKNELSMAFMRNTTNLGRTIKLELRLMS